MSCYKKVYHTRQEARNAKRELNLKHNRERPLLNIYRCEICSCYHVTTMTRVKGKEIEERIKNKKR